MRLDQPSLWAAMARSVCSAAIDMLSGWPVGLSTYLPLCPSHKRVGIPRPRVTKAGGGRAWCLSASERASPSHTLPKIMPP